MIHHLTQAISTTCILKKKTTFTNRFFFTKKPFQPTNQRTCEVDAERIMQVEMTKFQALLEMSGSRDRVVPPRKETGEERGIPSGKLT